METEPSDVNAASEPSSPTNTLPSPESGVPTPRWGLGAFVVVELAEWAAWRWAGPASFFLKAASPAHVVRTLPEVPQPTRPTQPPVPPHPCRE